MSSRPKKAIVIGAGVGGTATAARLAHAGLEVEVYEKNDFSGGRCSLIHHDGYRFDQGPSLFLLPPLFHQLYNDLGTTLEDHIDLIQCNPNYVIHYHDGQSVTLSSDRAQLAKEVEKFEGKGGAAALEGFMREAGMHGALSYELVLSEAFPTIFKLLKPKFIRHVFDLHILSSLYSRASRYFRTERMRRAFSFGSMYLGSSPFDCLGTYSLLQWTETCEGIHYPRGGFHKVPATLVSIAESQPTPAKFHYGATVKQVTYDSAGRTTGIELENGERKEADVVVVNADLAWAYNNLFKKGGGGDAEGQAEAGEELLDPRKAQQFLEKPHSCSSISFYWAMDSQIPALNAHNIFLAEDYKGSFDDIFKDHSMPREPSFYVNVPTRIDPSAAPEGKDSIVILVPVGHLLDDAKSLKTPKSNGDAGNKTETQNWDELVERARKQVIGIMEERLGVTNLREKITWEEVNTPLTWKEKFNLTHGSILGITHDFFNVLSFRHQARHPRVKGAYFVGASAHPGTGVPIAVAGSRLCAEAIFKDLGMNMPSSYGPIEPKKLAERSDLDIVHRRNLLYILENWFVAILPYLIGAIIALLSVGAWLWHTGRLFQPEDTTNVYVKFIGESMTGMTKSPVWGYFSHIPSLPVEVIPWFLLLFIAVVAPRLAKRVI